MSRLCLVDISKTEMNFDELNDLAKQLIEIALKDNIAVFFMIVITVMKLLKKHK